jgi:predicted ABC-type sugar transport system permease subunit
VAYNNFPRGTITTNDGLSILNVSIELQLVAKRIMILMALVLDQYLGFKK